MQFVLNLKDVLYLNQQRRWSALKIKQAVGSSTKQRDARDPAFVPPKTQVSMTYEMTRTTS